MPDPRVVAAAFLVAAGGLAAAIATPGAASGDDACRALWASARSASQTAQDDVGSGRDAGDAPESALPLPTGSGAPGTGFEFYGWGNLEPPVAHDAAVDLHDWFSIKLKGDGETVMINATSNYTVDEFPVYFTLEFWMPNGTVPTAVASSLTGETVSFTSSVYGRWLIHIRHQDQHDADAGLCAGTNPNPGPAAGPLPDGVARELQNYGFYMGCNPYCIMEDWNV